MPKDDDDDDKWIYRDHTAAKHEVLGNYLTPWINKLTFYNEQASQYNKIRIIDCFAGRGAYMDIEGTDPLELEHLSTSTDLPGSPQLILDVLTDRGGEFEEAECYFIEYNEENSNILSETLENTEGVASNVHYEDGVIEGRFEEEVLDLVETDGSDYPTLFFIDPFGFSSLDYDVITELGSTPQFEFLITFMYRDMNRFLDSDDHRSALDTVFGPAEWRSEVEDYDPKNWEGLVEYYTDRLEEQGPESTFEYLITEPDSDRTIYYLVFGTNHPDGMHTMQEVMSNCGTGSYAYAPKNPEYDRDQAELGAFGSGTENTKSFLLDRFAGYRISFQKMVRTCSNEDSSKYREESEADYRAAVRELENEGVVDIMRITSSKDGIQGKDLIDFPSGE